MARRYHLFHNHYERLIEKAARSGLLPASGLTPREQRENLRTASALAAADQARLDRLHHLLDRSVYAMDGEEATALEGISLCEQLSSALPTVTLAPSGARSRPTLQWREWISTLIPFIALGGLIALVAMAALRLPGLSLGGLGVSSSSSLTGAGSAFEYASEREAVDASAGDWSSSPNKATLNIYSISRTLDARELDQARTPGFDIETGEDGLFRNAVDPFRPPLRWTHRHHVFTDVDSSYQIVTGTLASARDATGDGSGALKQYSATISARLQPGKPLPIPSPSADAVVIDYSSTPAMNIHFVKDSADALYAIADRNALIELSYTLTVGCDYSYAPLSSAPFEPVDMQLPANVQSDAQQVISAIGGLPASTFDGTVRRLQAYFAGFSVAPIKSGEFRANDYLTIALARKGVCRHRARSFFITANALGLPTRLVENQVHSFCEVRQPDGSWRRIEFRLGNEPWPAGPSPATDSAASSAPGNWRMAYAAAWLLPPMAVLLLGVLWLARRDEVRTHVTESASDESRAIRRARRDVREGRITASALNLIALVRTRLQHELPDAFAGVGVKQRSALDASGVPAMIQSRVNRIVKTSESAAHGASGSLDLQRVYWDCHHVLHWLNRRNRK